MRWCTPMLLLAVGCGFHASNGLPDATSGPHDQDGATDGATSSDASSNPLTCAGYVAPVPCDTENGLAVYCVAPGATIVFQAELDYPPNVSVAALGVGTVIAGSPNVSLGYFEGTQPFTCAPTGCEHAVGFGNSGAGGLICEVAFDLTLPAASSGTGLYAIKVAATATDGDYLLGYVGNTWTVVTPDFYLRVGAGGVLQ